MEIFLKRYFWTLNLLVIAVCAFFAARGFNAWLEAKYLLDDGVAKAKAPPVPQQPQRQPTFFNKDEQAVVNRNIFCHTCEPPQAVAINNEPPVDPNHPQPTTLPLVLLATSVAREGNAIYTSATLSNTTTLRSGMYWLHEEIPDAGEIISITPRWVDFRNRANGRIERVDLLGASAPPPPAPVAMTQPPPGAAPAPGGDGDLTAELDRSVHKIDDTHYDVDRSLVNKVLADPSVVMRQARIVPSMKDGQPNGIKMYAIKPNSAYAKLGLQNGDTIHAVNGYELTSLDKGLEVFAKVKSASSLSIQVTRRGQPVTMEYQIK